MDRNKTGESRGFGAMLKRLFGGKEEVDGE
jgi:hypothetical protein